MYLPIKYLCILNYIVLITSSEGGTELPLKLFDV